MSSLTQIFSHKPPSGQHEVNVLPEMSANKQVSYVVTAVLVCSEWLAFNSDTAGRQWAISVLGKQRSGIQLSPSAIVEVIVGRSLPEPGLKQNMLELLQLLTARAGFAAISYQIEFWEMDLPVGVVWGATAVSSG